DPHVKGEIDRFGNFLDGSGHYLIHPYILYRTQDDLYAVHKCAAGKRNTAIYYKCLASNTDGRGGLKVHPISAEKAAARDNGMKLGRGARRQSRLWPVSAIVSAVTIDIGSKIRRHTSGIRSFTALQLCVN